MILSLLIISKMLCPLPQGTQSYRIAPTGMNKSAKTTYINESFENWPPSSFTLSPASGGGAWQQSPVTTADYISPQEGADGSHAAEFDCWDYNSGITGDMISAPVDLSNATTPVLSFYFWNHQDLTGYGNNDSTIVYISTDNGATWNIIDVLKGDVSNWTLHSYDLSSYIGDTIMVKFTGVSDYGGSNMGIDEVRIGQTPPYDVAIKSVLTPSLYNPVTMFNPAVIIASEGTHTAYVFTIYAEAYHKGQLTYTDSVFVDSLQSGQLDTIYFSTFHPDSGYLYTFKFHAVCRLDSFAQNDSAQQEARFYYSDRMVVGELITNSGCSPCKPANDTLDEIFPDYPNTLALIRYHAWWPSSTDPFYIYNTPENQNRIYYYGADYAPHFHIDGTVDGGADRDNWRGMLDEEMQKKSPVQITVSGTYDNTGASGNIDVKIKATGEIPDSVLYLRVALVENGIPYNASNGQTIFYQVFRKMLPDTNGIDVHFNIIGDTSEFTIPFTIDTATFNEDSLEFVAFLQSDASKEIFQGAKIALSSLTGIGEKASNNSERLFYLQNLNKIVKDMVILNYSLPSSGNVKITIYNTAGQVVYSAHQYKTRGGNYTSHISTASFKKGVYFLRLTFNKSTITTKFMKIK